MRFGTGRRVGLCKQQRGSMATASSRAQAPDDFTSELNTGEPECEIYTIFIGDFNTKTNS